MTITSLAAMVPNPVSLAATVVLIASIQLQVRAVEVPVTVFTVPVSWYAVLLVLASGSTAWVWRPRRS